MTGICLFTTIYASTTQRDNEMKVDNLKVGNKVSYSAFIGNTPLSENHEVKSIEPMPNNYGCDVAWITGKSGCIDVEHLELM